MYLDYSVSSGPFMRFSMRVEFLSKMFDHSVCEIRDPSLTIDNKIEVCCCLQQPGEMMFTSCPHWDLNLDSNSNILMNRFIVKIGEVGKELSRFSGKMGTFCDENCRNKKQSYTYKNI